MGELPSGVVTFMLTDVEDSTRKWETNPEAMRHAMLEHDRILALEIQRRDGFIVESGRRFRASRGALSSAQDEGRRAVARGVREAGGYGVSSAILPDVTSQAADGVS